MKRTMVTAVLTFLLGTWATGAIARMEPTSATTEPKFDDVIGSDAVDVELFAILFGQGFVAGNAPNTVFSPGRFDVVVNIDGEKAGLFSYTRAAWCYDPKRLGVTPCNSDLLTGLPPLRQTEHEHGVALRRPPG